MINRSRALSDRYTSRVYDGSAVSYDGISARRRLQIKTETALWRGWTGKRVVSFTGLSRQRPCRLVAESGAKLPLVNYDELGAELFLDSL